MAWAGRCKIDLSIERQTSDERKHMRTIIPNTWMPSGKSPFATVATVQPAPNQDQSATASKTGKTFTGTVVSVDLGEQRLLVKNWLMFHKSFNLGDHCVYFEPGNASATPDMLRPGEKVEVTYLNNQGVLIAGRVEQIPMQLTGMITALDVFNHTLTLQQAAIHKQLQLPDDCQILLRDGQIGALGDIKIGNYVTVTYETPEDVPTARQISQTSREFAGILTAVDLENRTIRVKSMSVSKKFHLTSGCAILFNDKPDGQMQDLRLNGTFVLSYDEIDGINVVNRIAPGPTPLDDIGISGPSPGF
jgi:hypothetical protein